MRLLIPLFSPATGTWGGMTRVVAMHDAARRAGHEVAFCASGAMADGLHKHGYKVYPTPATTMLGLPAPISRLLEKRSQKINLPVKPGKSVGSIWMVMVLSGFARSSYLKALVDAEREAVKDFRPSHIFTDLDPAAFLVSMVERIPMSSSYAAVMHEGIGGWAWERMNAAAAPVLKACGIPEQPIDDICFSRRVLKIIPSIPELDGSDPSQPDIQYVGQLLGPVQPGGRDAFQTEAGKRYVFVYLGTGSLSLDNLRAVLPEVFKPAGHLICLVGSQSITQPETRGAVRFLPYVPADAVLPLCDWVICHGGQNTITQSLLNGVPLIVFPGPIFERRFNAARVQEAGAGFMAERNQFTVDWLCQALQQQAALAHRAAQLGERIRSYGGAAAAIQAIMKQ